MSYRSLLVAALVAAALLAPARPAAAQAPATAPSVLEDPLVRYQAQRGLDLLYDLRYDEADRLFSQIDRRYPEHPIGPFLKALGTWWAILLDLGDTSHDEAFYRQMDAVIARADRLLARDEDSFDAMFFKGAALGFRGRLRSNRGDWWKAAMDGRKAMSYVLEVAERAPENADYGFGKGIYDYYAAAVPERYPFVRPVMVFFPDGDKARGLAALARTAEEGHYIRTEAAYFLLQIYYLFEADFDRSVEYITLLRERHPSNPYFHAFEGRVWARWGQWRESRSVFEDILSAHAAGRRGYNDATAEQAHYFVARAAMAYAEYEDALRHLEALDRSAARTDADTYFKVWGRLRTGMALDALGRRGEATRAYGRVLAMKDWADAHATARRYLETPYVGRRVSPSAPAGGS